MNKNVGRHARTSAAELVDDFGWRESQCALKLLLPVGSLFQRRQFFFFFGQQTDNRATFHCVHFAGKQTAIVFDVEMRHNPVHGILPYARRLEFQKLYNPPRC